MGLAFAPLQNRKIYNVSELVHALKDVMNERFPAVWVRGEISNIKAYASGHAYPTLKDQDAQLPCALFKGVWQNLKFSLEEGLSVIAFGRLDIYAPRGTCQFIIQGLEPDGIGALQLAFEQLKKKLTAEGLFDSTRKRALPFLPKTVGIVTSWHGAALHDMLTVLRRRFPNVHVVVYPVAVQGERAKAEIAEAIRYLSDLRLCDVMIVGRGGGAAEDLWAFNEEVVARAIASSAVPVVSAVGHETDFTIADFTADVRAATPSVAATLVVPEKMEILADLKALQARLFRSRQAIMRDCLDRLFRLRLRLPMPRRVWEQWRLKLGRLQDDLYQNLVLKIRDFQFRLRECQLRLINPQNAFSEAQENVQRYRLALRQVLTNQLREAAGALEKNRIQLRLLSPENVLKRGYVLTRTQDGRVITRVSQLGEGDRLILVYQDGSVQAEIQKGGVHGEEEGKSEF